MNLQPQPASVIFREWQALRQDSISNNQVTAVTGDSINVQYAVFFFVTGVFFTIGYLAIYDHLQQKGTRQMFSVKRLN